MDGKRVRPTSTQYLPPVICPQSQRPRFSLKLLLVVTGSTAVGTFLGTTLLAHADSLAGDVAELLKDLKVTSATPGTTAASLISASLLPVALLAMAALKLPRNATILTYAPLGLVTMFFMVLIVRELKHAIRVEEFAARADSSLYVILCMSLTCGLVSTVLGLAGGIALATINRGEP